MNNYKDLSLILIESRFTGLNHDSREWIGETNNLIHAWLHRRASEKGVRCITARCCARTSSIDAMLGYAVLNVG